MVETATQFSIQPRATGIQLGGGKGVRHRCFSEQRFALYEARVIDEHRSRLHQRRAKPAAVVAWRCGSIQFAGHIPQGSFIDTQWHRLLRMRGGVGLNVSRGSMLIDQLWIVQVEAIEDLVIVVAGSGLL